MKKLYSLLLFIVFGILSSNAQVLDETFVKPTTYKAAKITVIKELSEGKILLGGNIQFFKDKKVNNLIRTLFFGTQFYLKSLTLILMPDVYYI